MSRELEQVTPSGGDAPGFYVRINNNLTPLTQNLPSSSLPLPTRTNYLQDIFILTRQNQNWVGIGYTVRLADPTGALWPAQMGDGIHAGVGSLYRFEERMPVLAPATGGVSPLGYPYPLAGRPTDPTQLWNHFTNACYAANSGAPFSRIISNRICDGVVQLYLRAFATNGFPIYTLGAGTAPLFRTNSSPLNLGYCVVKSAAAHSTGTYPDNMDLLYTWSNAVPAYLELELGILEPRTFARFDSIGAPAARLAYFQRDDTSTRVQLFRQRIPVRNVDPTAFQ